MMIFVRGEAHSCQVELPLLVARYLLCYQGDDGGLGSGSESVLEIASGLIVV